MSNEVMKSQMSQAMSESSDSDSEAWREEVLQRMLLKVSHKDTTTKNVMDLIGNELNYAYADLKTISELCKHPKFDINYRYPFEDNQNVLLLSLVCDQPEAFEYLCRLPDVDINIKDDNGYTPLIHAVKLNDIDTVKLICGFPDINLNIKDCFGRTALLMCYNLEIVKYLCGLPNIDINCTDDDGNGVLLYPVSMHRKEILEYYLGLGVKPSKVKCDKYDVLLNYETYVIIKLLSDNGIEMEFTD